jgi:hypothetical protein
MKLQKFNSQNTLILRTVWRTASTHLYDLHDIKLRDWCGWRPTDNWGLFCQFSILVLRYTTDQLQWLALSTFGWLQQTWGAECDYWGQRTSDKSAWYIQVSIICIILLHIHLYTLVHSYDRLQCPETLLFLSIWYSFLLVAEQTIGPSAAGRIM